MTQHSKAYRAVADKIDKDNLYTPLQATTLAKESGSKKYDSTVDVSMRLGVDPRKADQMVRGTVNLPHGTGKTSRVLVFATGANADAAREAGADHVGADDGFVEHDGIHANQAAVLDFTAVDHGAMADGHIVADDLAACSVRVT